MKFPKQKQNLPVSAVIAKSQETGGEKIVTNVNLSGIFSLLTSLSIVLPIPSDGPLSNSRYFSDFSSISSEKQVSRWGMRSILMDTGATPLVLNPTAIKQPLP